MVKEKANLTPRGILKVQAYNEDGVFYEKTKHNLVVESANEIIAEALANPNKKVAATLEEVKGTKNDTAEARGYGLHLDKAFAEFVEVEVPFSETNEETTKVIPEMSNLKEVVKVFVPSEDEEGEGQELVLNKDFRIKDENTGTVEFTEAPKGTVVFEAKVRAERGYRIKQGSVKVEADAFVYTEGEVANEDEKTFVVDYDLGIVFFENPKTRAKVTYDIEMPYGINFMALGGKPTEDWEEGRPVEFGQSDKLKIKMENEIAKTRVPLIFPKKISQGAPELDLGIKTQPIAKAEVTDNVTIVPQGDGAEPKLVYNINNKFDEGNGLAPKILEEILEVTNITKDKEVITEKVKVVKNKIEEITIEFEEGAVDINDIIEIKYDLKLSNQHLIYKLGQAPVLKLLSVRHVNSLDSTDIREYKIVKNGLEAGEGDVWISNSNLGNITFSAKPVGVDPEKPAPEVHTPGTLQVEYLVNSGSAVQFVANFPKGTPESTVQEDTMEVVLGTGVTSVTLPDTVVVKPDGDADIINITADGIELDPHEYTVGEDNKTISLSAATPGQKIVVTFNKEVDNFNIYQVAMFDQQAGGRMFNITGIGPIPKDKNTGISVTWTIVF